MNPDDPEVTAYALGEIARLEQRPMPDTATKIAVEQTQTLGAWVREGLRQEAALGLLRSQREELMELAARSPSKVVSLVPFWRQPSILSAMAACVVVGMGFGLLLVPAITAQRAAVLRAAAAVANRPARLTDQEGFRIALSSNPEPVTQTEALYMATMSFSAPQIEALLKRGTPPMAQMVPWTPERENPALPARPAPGLNTSGPLVVATSPVREEPVAESQVFKIKGLGAPSATGSSYASRSTGTAELGGIQNRAGTAPIPHAKAAGAIQVVGFVRVSEQPLTTLPIAGSKRSEIREVRSSLEKGTLPPADSVRVQDWINAFAPGEGVSGTSHPEGATLEVGPCPWATDHRLVRIVIRTKSDGRTGISMASQVRGRAEFNPSQVHAYSLVQTARAEADADLGRSLESSGGSTSTILYEIVPVSGSAVGGELKYQQVSSKELLSLKLEYLPGAKSGKVRLVEFALKDPGTRLDQCSPDFRFTAAVAGFALNVAGKAGAAGLAPILQLARESIGSNSTLDRVQFARLVEKASEVR